MGWGFFILDKLGRGWFKDYGSLDPTLVPLVPKTKFSKETLLFTVSNWWVLLEFSMFSLLSLTMSRLGSLNYLVFEFWTYVIRFHVRRPYKVTWTPTSSFMLSVWTIYSSNVFEPLGCFLRTQFFRILGNFHSAKRLP
jgi:hypothetical protein